MTRAPITPSAREQALEIGRAALLAARNQLAGTLLSREPGSGKPPTLIAELAVAMAGAVGLPDEEIERIHTASLLHDLGEVSIPETILTKTDGLTPPEWRTITEHPKIGQLILEEAGALRDAASIVLHHHEWWDGRGYPHGLAGRDIPLGARIVAIADAYEAMIGGRPYRAAKSHREALAELERHAGTQFDAQLVKTFCALFAAGVPGDLVSFPEHLRMLSDRSLRALPREEAPPAPDPVPEAWLTKSIARVPRTGTEG